MRMRTQVPKAARIITPGMALVAILALTFAGAQPDRSRAEEDSAAKNPSPIALALSADGSRLLVANQGTGSVALIDPKEGKVLADVTTGDRPAGVALAR